MATAIDRFKYPTVADRPALDRQVSYIKQVADLYQERAEADDPKAFLIDELQDCLEIIDELLDVVDELSADVEMDS